MSLGVAVCCLYNFFYYIMVYVHSFFFIQRCTILDTDLTQSLVDEGFWLLVELHQRGSAAIMVIPSSSWSNTYEMLLLRQPRVLGYRTSWPDWNDFELLSM